MRRRERDLRAFCCAARRELRFDPRADREEEIRERLSLSGAMWNWLVVSEMSWEVLVGSRSDWILRADETYCYGIFVEQDHGGRCMFVCVVSLRQLVVK